MEIRQVIYCMIFSIKRNYHRNTLYIDIVCGIPSQIKSLCPHILLMMNLKARLFTYITTAGGNVKLSVNKAFLLNLISKNATKQNCKSCFFSLVKLIKHFYWLSALFISNVYVQTIYSKVSSLNPYSFLPGINW